jgi:hypothetical protein
VIRPETDELDAAGILVPTGLVPPGVINISLLLIGLVFTEIRDSVGLSPQDVLDQGTPRVLNLCRIWSDFGHLRRSGL